jgi:hypothetical protein
MAAYAYFNFSIMLASKIGLWATKRGTSLPVTKSFIKCSHAPVAATFQWSNHLNGPFLQRAQYPKHCIHRHELGRKACFTPRLAQTTQAAAGQPGSRSAVQRTSMAYLCHCHVGKQTSTWRPHLPGTPSGTPANEGSSSSTHEHSNEHYHQVVVEAHSFLELKTAMSGLNGHVGV